MEQHVMPVLRNDAGMATDTRIVYIILVAIGLLGLMVASSVFLLSREPSLAAEQVRVPIIDGAEYMEATKKGLSFKQRYNDVLKMELNKYGAAKLEQFNVLHLTALPLIQQVLGLPEVFPKSVPKPPIVDEYVEEPELLRRDIANSTDGQEWNKHAAVVHAAVAAVPFSKSSVLPLIQFLENKLIKDAALGSLVDRFVIDVLGKYILGLQLGTLLGQPHAWASLYRALTSPNLHKEERAQKVKELDALTYKLIETKRDDLKSKPRQAFDDLLASMIAANESVEEKLTDEELRNNVMSLFVQGQDPLSSGLLSCLYALARYPSTDIKATIFEALRQNPPTPLLPGRRAMPDLSSPFGKVQAQSNAKRIAGGIGGAYIGPDKEKGVYLPRGTGVSVNVYGVNMTRGLWGADAAEWSLKRWINNATEQTETFDSLDKDKRWLVFGYGQRKCPGRHFSLNILQTVCEELASKYELTLPEGSLHAEELQYAGPGSLPFRPRDDLEITFSKK